MYFVLLHKSVTLLEFNSIKLLNSIYTFLFLFFHISTCEKLLQFKSDNSAIGFGSGTAALEQAIEKTKANIKWVSENQREITDWLVAESA